MINKSETIKIRKAGKEDIPIILDLIKELAEYEKLSDEVSADEIKLKNTLFGETKYAEVLIAEYNGKPAGQALFFYNYSTFLAKPGIYLEDLFVKPEYRGKGIGKKLLTNLIQIAKEKDYGRVEWAVLDWNESAIKFYKNLGADLMNDWKIFRLTEDKF